MKMQKFEEDISAFREELINKKTSFLNIGIPKLKLKDNAAEIVGKEIKTDNLRGSVVSSDLPPPQIMKGSNQDSQPFPSAFNIDGSYNQNRIF